MNPSEDAYGQQLKAQYTSGSANAEFIERDDNYIDTGSDVGMYFSVHADWAPREQQAIGQVRGRILDIGSGAGRHSLYLQSQGFDVTAIDNSPGAIEVCKLRGVNKAMVRSIADVDKFAPDSFDTILMLGNNFGLFGGKDGVRSGLDMLSGITSPTAQIIAGARNPYHTDSADHLEYHELNRSRGRMPGQIRMRVRYRRSIGEWFDHLLVSPDEMREILIGTGWQVKEFLAENEPNYFALIAKC